MRSKFLFTVGLAMSVAVAATAYQAAQKLLVNGKVASTDVRIIGGKAYVPLSDVAKALDYSVAKTTGGFQLVKAGGANPIAGTHVGKVGDEILAGPWKFTVVGVERVPEHVPQYLANEAWTRRSAKSGQEIVVVKCRLKNGTSKKDTVVLDHWKGSNTTLTDMDENSFEPTQHGFDARFSEHFPNGSTFLPGAAINFNIRFEVPKDTKLKDLVFTVIRYDARGDIDKVKPTDIRVHLVDSSG